MLKDDVKVLIIADTYEQRNSWINAIRIRIAPWQVLFERAKRLMKHKFEICAQEELLQELNDLKIDPENDYVKNKRLKTSQDGKRRVNIHDKVKEYEDAEKWVTHISKVFTSVVYSIGKTSDAFETVAKYSNAIPSGIGSLFNIFLLITKAAKACGEANRGIQEFPDMLYNVMNIFKSIVNGFPMCFESLKKATTDDDLLLGSIFEVLVDILDLIAEVEDYLMKEKSVKIKDAKSVQEIDEKYKSLKTKSNNALLYKKVLRNEQSLSSEIDCFKPIMMNPYCLHMLYLILNQVVQNLI